MTPPDDSPKSKEEIIKELQERGIIGKKATKGEEAMKEIASQLKMFSGFLSDAVPDAKLVIYKYPRDMDFGNEYKKIVAIEKDIHIVSCDISAEDIVIVALIYKQE